MRRSGRLLGAVTAIGLLAGACSIPKDPEPAARPANPAARTGGSLTVGITAPAGVDPLNFYEPSGMLIASVMCETLVAIDPETGILLPGLAQKWTITDDGSRIIVQLRKHVKFHDGREVRSADIADAIKRLANPQNSSYASELLDPIRGVAEYRKAIEDGDAFPNIQGVRIIEPFSFELFLNAKLPDYLRTLAHVALAPVSKSPYDVDPTSAPKQPKCAGPYKLRGPFTAGDPEVVLERFAGYNSVNFGFTNKGGGYPDEIKFRFYQDAEAAYQAQVRGEVDVAPIPPARLPEAQTRLGDRLILGDLPHEEFIAVPYGEHLPAAFSNDDFRAALSQSLDRTRIVREAWGESRRPADGFAPPALRNDFFAGFDRRTGRKKAPVEFGCAETAPVAGDPAAAKQSLAKLKPKELDAVKAQPLKLYFNDEFAHRPMAESVAAQWREVLGLEVEVVPMSWDEYVKKATIGVGFDGAFRMSYTPQYPSLMDFFGSLFHSRAAGSTNLQQYTNLAFDQTFTDDLAPMVDEQERLIQYRNVEQKLCRDLPMIPVAFGRAAWARGDRVIAATRSQRLITTDGIPMLREMAVAQ